MRLSKRILGYRGFLSKAEICRFIENSKNYDPNLEPINKAEGLLIFETSKQHTWLVSTSMRVYCILDDARKTEPHINWSRRKDLLINEDITVNPKTEKTGLVDIGTNHKNWLFSEQLFVKEPIGTAIQKLMNST